MDVPVSLDESPTAFLTRMKEAYKNILSILGDTHAKLLSLTNEPYQQDSVDRGYVEDMGTYLCTVLMYKDACSDFSNELLKPTTKDKEVDIGESETKLKVLKMIKQRIELIIEARVASTKEKYGEVYLPRILRLSKKFDFTKNEIKLAVAILVWQGGYYHPDAAAINFHDHYSADPVGLSVMLDIPLGEILVFLNMEREHINQGFFPDLQDNYLLNSNCAYDLDYFKALVGSQLKSEEFLKLEQTFLADVITEEPRKEHYRTGEQQDVPQDLGELSEAEGSEAEGEGSEGEGSEGEGSEGEGSEAEGSEGEDSEAEGSEGEDEGSVAEGSEGEAEGLEGEEEKTEEDMEEENDDLGTIIRLEREREKTTVRDTTEDAAEGEGGDKLKPYKTDLEYLDDHFQLISYKLKVKSADKRMEEEAQCEDGYPQTKRYLRQKREAQTKEKVQGTKCAKRLALTKAAGGWSPRLERMVESRNLCQFEKNILLALIGSIIQPNKFSLGEFAITKNCAQVGDMLELFCPTLEEQIHHRKYFYKSSSLVREGMVVVQNSGLTGDPSTATVEVDRRMLDFCVGLDTEFSEIVEGSHLYFPKTKFEHVILPKDQKQLILDTVSNFEAYKRCRKKMGMDDVITYGAGMVMLFHGAPGTGKTMMANALANKLNKKVLLINFPSLGVMKTDENFKFIFREAKINDAILFFDECEGIFESREAGGHHQVNLLLTQIERHDGLIILATNRPYDLDEAMHRRIMIALEFRQPDHLLRKSIWDSHMPKQMKLGGDISLDDLAVRYELTGGFIKNAILSALSIAVSREGDNPVISQKDLLQGANLQLRGCLRMKDFDRRVIPSAGLDEVVVEEDIMKQLKQIVQFEKARSVLFGQWGFSKRNHKGLTVLLHGQPGTGKTMVAEAIGFEVGKPLKVINCGELLSKWVGESTKNIDAIFQEAQSQEAILVFDEAEGLFGQRTKTGTSTDRYANIDVGVLLYHIERFPGIVILTTNLIENLDMAFFRRLRFVLQLDIPRQVLRAKLWKLLIPEETPIAEDVEFTALAQHKMSGGNIKNAIFRAAAAAALREKKLRLVTMDDLVESCREEVAKTAKRMGFKRQDSETARIYN